MRFPSVDHLWTTRLQQLAIAQHLTFENLNKDSFVKGIDKRTHKDGTVSYQARVRIKGHPVLIQSFAMKWKRDTESAIERGAFMNLSH